MLLAPQLQPRPEAAIRIPVLFNSGFTLEGVLELIHGHRFITTPVIAVGNCIQKSRMTSGARVATEGHPFTNGRLDEGSTGKTGKPSSAALRATLTGV